MMATSSKTTDSDMVVQEHCIDLPGESVQCWIGGGTDKLKVILRKHRDVIFDINIGNGKTYTLEATESDFYNVRDKKLVVASQHGKVTFKDGERTHVWVSRGFRGALVLKSGETLIYKVKPNEWDTHQYGEDPKEKPAPIVVAIGSDTPRPTALSKTTPYVANTNSPVSIPVPAASPVSAPAEGFLCPVVCVVDGKVEGMPANISEHFKKGGDHSGLADIDPNHVATRNWIWGQVAGTGAYVKDNWEWLRASLDGKTSKGFKLVKAQVRYVRGKVRFYFSGYSNSNTIFGRGGFGPAHDRIMTIFSGVGKTSSSFSAASRGLAATFKGSALVSFVFGAATSFAEWKDDAHKDGYDLAAALITSTVKAILAAAATTLAVVAFLAIAMFFMSATVPVIAVGAATVIAGFFANYVIEAIDKSIGRAVTHDEANSDGTSSAIAPLIRRASNQVQEKIHQNWEYLMYKMSSDYREIEF
jgi:uncharacterized protein (DUF779 family)